MVLFPEASLSCSAPAAAQHATCPISHLCSHTIRRDGEYLCASTASDVLVFESSGNGDPVGIVEALSHTVAWSPSDQT